MTVFRYRAMTPAGKIVTGLYEASSEAAVIHYVRSIGSYPISAAQSGALIFEKLLFWRARQRISISGLAHATQELASLLGAGVELDRALGILVNLDGIQSLKAPFASVRDHIRDGTSLADALSRESCFPPFYVSAARAGEYGGNLEATLLRLADYLTRTVAVRETITSALVYPSILVVTACCAIFFILVFVLPQFEPLFAEAGRNLPLSTRVVMAVGHGLANYWWLMVASAMGLTIWIRRLLKNPISRIRIHAAFLRIPLLGALIVSAQRERFFRTLGSLISSGVALPTALAIAANTVTNEKIAGSLRDAASRLREGERLAERLQLTRIFPAAALDLVRIGEETGKLDTMLLRQADLDAQRLKQTVDRLLALLVPALTVVIGIIVAGLIASMLVALLSVNDLALQ